MWKCETFFFILQVTSNFRWACVPMRVFSVGWIQKKINGGQVFVRGCSERWTNLIEEDWVGVFDVNGLRFRLGVLICLVERWILEVFLILLLPATIPPAIQSTGKGNSLPNRTGSCLFLKHHCLQDDRSHHHQSRQQHDQTGSRNAKNLKNIILQIKQQQSKTPRFLFHFRFLTWTYPELSSASRRRPSGRCHRCWFHICTCHSFCHSSHLSQYAHQRICSPV